MKLLGTLILVKELPNPSETGYLGTSGSDRIDLKVKLGEIVEAGVETREVKVGEWVIFDYGFKRFALKGEHLYLGSEKNVVAVVAKDELMPKEVPF